LARETIGTWSLAYNFQIIMCAVCKGGKNTTIVSFHGYIAGNGIQCSDFRKLIIIIQGALLIELIKE
jgi:hypothetical protein